MGVIPADSGPAVSVADESETRPSRLRRWLGVLLAVQVLLAVTALAVWIWTPDAPPLPPETRETARLVGGGATIESALPLAQAQADAWLPGATLLNASMQVDWPWTVPPGQTEAVPATGWLTYVFINKLLLEIAFVDRFYCLPVKIQMFCCFLDGHILIKLKNISGKPLFNSLIGIHEWKHFYHSTTRLASYSSIVIRVNLLCTFFTAVTYRYIPLTWFYFYLYCFFISIYFLFQNLYY